MNTKGMIFIIAGIVLVVIVSYFMFNILNPHYFSEEIKSLCNQVGGEWKTELGLCINIDKVTCESYKIFGGYGNFLTFEELENFGIDLDSACLWSQPATASNTGMPDWEQIGETQIGETQIGEVKRGETQIKPGESFSVSINLVKESYPTLSFSYNDIVNTNCVTRTFETGEFLSMQVLNPNKDVIIEVDAEVLDPFFVCPLNLKEATRDLRVAAGSGLIKVEAEGVYTMIISNPKDTPVDIFYSLKDELGRMLWGN